MTWIAHLDGGPLDGGRVTLHCQYGAVALPIGEIADGLAVYGLWRNEADCLGMPTGRLKYVFETVREHTLAEARLFAAVPARVEVVAA